MTDPRLADGPGPRHLDDPELLAALGHALDADDPMPDHLHHYAAALFDLGGLDAELAALTYDSAADAAPLAMRSSPATADVEPNERVLVFSAGSVSVEVELVPSPSGDHRLHGLLTPATGVTVVAQTVTGSHPVALDAAGSFGVAVPAGQVRLCITTADGHAVVTPWFQAG